MGSVRALLAERLKRLLAPLRYPQPTPELAIDRLYLYLDTLWNTRDVPGAVVEIGCFQCGTSAWATRFLQSIGRPRAYVCIDTFSGFPSDQFRDDVAVGTDASHRRGFGANSKALVTQLLERWDCSSIQLVEADIVSLPADTLPDRIAVALVDVDLQAPTRAALEKIYPRLAPDGAMLIDDCAENGSFRGARLAYREFVAKHRLPERYAFGMGCVGG